MDQILGLLSESGYPIMDEVDTLLNILHEVSFSIGKPVSVDKNESKTISVLYEILYSDMQIKSLARLESDSNPDPQAPPITKELYHTRIKNALADAFIERIGQIKWPSPVLRNKCPKFVSSLSDQDKILLKQYLTHDELHVAEAQAFYNNLDPDIQNIVAMAGQEISQYLPYTLTLNSNEKYGFDEKGRLAIPYSAAFCPNIGSTFKNSHITMNNTYQIFVKEGISKELIEKEIQSLQQKALKEIQEKSELTVEDTKAWKTFCKIKGKLNVPLFNYTQSQLNLIQKRLNYNVKTKCQFVTDIILPHLELFESTLTINQQNLVGFFGRCNGFTGTLWNAKTMHQRLKAVPEAGTDAKTISLLWQNSYDAVFTSTENNPAKIFNQLQTQFGEFDALIDGGGYFKEGNNQQNARMMAKATNKPFIFYNSKGEQTLTNGKTEIPLSDSKKREHERKTFYDQSHTTGADVKQKPTAVAIVTVGRNILLRDLEQHSWRLRGLDKSQRVVFALSKEVDGIIREVCDKMENEAITFEDILRFAIYNQGKQIGQDTFKALKQQWWNIPQVMLIKVLLSNQLTEQEKKRATDELKDLWIKPANRPAKELYGKIAIERKKELVIAEEEKKCTDFLDNLFNKLPFLGKIGLTKEACLQEAKEMTSRLAPDLPPKLLSPQMDEENTVELENEMAIEQETETEKETQIHIEKQKQS